MRKLFLMLLLALAALLFFASRAQTPARFQPVIPQSGKAATEQPDPCHHAVVCGGVHDAPRHGYKEYTLPYNIWGFVQYRKDGKLYFTRAERMIPKGTLVREDALGHIILERCGNMVTQSADVDATPVTEPTDIFPPTPPEISSEVPPPFPPTGPTPPPTGPVPPTVPGPPYTPCCGFFIPPGTPSVPVPEPSTIYFTLFGVVFVIGASRVWKRGEYYLDDRREHPRTPGAFKKAEDMAHEAVRSYGLAEPEAKCASCGAPLESGHKCEHC